MAPRTPTARTSSRSQTRTETRTKKIPAKSKPKIVKLRGLRDLQATKQRLLSASVDVAAFIASLGKHRRTEDPGNERYLAMTRRLAKRRAKAAALRKAKLRAQKRLKKPANKTRPTRRK